MGRPIISALEYPNIRSASRFHEVTWPVHVDANMVHGLTPSSGGT